MLTVAPPRIVATHSDWHIMEIMSSQEEQFPGLQSNSAAVDLRMDETKRLNEFIALELSSVGEVEYVFSGFRNNVFYVWVLLDRFESAVRERIYDREKLIIDEFPMFEFDFYLISRVGRDPDELISGSNELVYDRYQR